MGLQQILHAECQKKIFSPSTQLSSRSPFLEEIGEKPQNATLLNHGRSQQGKPEGQLRKECMNSWTSSGEPARDKDDQISGNLVFATFKSNQRLQYCSCCFCLKFICGVCTIKFCIDDKQECLSRLQSCWYCLGLFATHLLNHGQLLYKNKYTIP